MVVSLLAEPRRSHRFRASIHRRNARRLGFAFWTNMILAVGWAIMGPVALVTSLKSSVPFLARRMSLRARKGVSRLGAP